MLLDFGMTIALEDPLRLGYAQLALTAEQMDIQRLQEGIRALGIRNNQMDTDPSRDLDFWRYMLRDTAGRDESVAQSKDYFARKMAERNEDKASGKDTRVVESLPSSFIFFWRVIGLLRGLCTQARDLELRTHGSPLLTPPVCSAGSARRREASSYEPTGHPS